MKKPVNYTQIIVLLQETMLLEKMHVLFFKNMAISNLNDEYKKLLVAPFGLKNKFNRKNQH